MLIAMISLGGCETATFNASVICPPWPKAGPQVADELSRLPALDYPATWEWIARLEKLRDQLEERPHGR